jgi:hypothetical protein
MLEDVDGGIWVVKARNNPQGSKVVIAELACSMLGQMLRAAVRRGAICDVPPELAMGLKFTPDGTWESGDAFGSELLDGGNLYVPTMHPKLANREALVAVVALDTWTTAHDGRQARARLTAANEYEVFGVDFGHNFGPANWDRASLASIATPVGLVDSNEWAVGAPTGVGSNVAAAVRAIGDDDLQDLIGSIPTSWGLGSEDGEALAEFLAGRREAVAKLLEQLE